MSFKANVRIIVPPAVVNNVEYVGHYDLQLSGSVNMMGKNFVNPVFSYRRKESKLDIFNQSDSSLIYKSKDYRNSTIYEWSFTIANDAKLNEFCQLIAGEISGYINHPDCTDGLKCTIRSDNVFSEYDLITTNCFRAVATWLNALGNYTLKLIYDGTHDNAYMKYSAQKTVDKYFDNCEFFNP